ncbi:MAG: hypothetical protein J7L16_04500 [Deltaproteobacteria bacterium]|nr:hypothetical protein [Deltaproteobacteria bacterium]
MEDYKKGLALALAETGAIFFDKDLTLKDGRPTPCFINMAMFSTGRRSLKMGSFFAGMMVFQGIVKNTDIILGPSYKGSSIALSTAISLWIDHRFDLLFDYDRKELKTHGEATVSKSIFVNRTFFDGCRIFIVDDVATSMETKYDLIRKIETEACDRGMKFHIVGIGIAVDREQTTAVYDRDGNVVFDQKGENAIDAFEKKSGIPVYSVAGIVEVIDYLYVEKIPVIIRGVRTPIDKGTKEEFDEYINTYGVN